MRIVIFGANGGTGRIATAQALAVGHRVAAVTRHPEDFPLGHDDLEVVAADVHDEAQVVAASLRRGPSLRLPAQGGPLGRHLHQPRPTWPPA